MSVVTPSMVLITSEWNSKKSFRLIPVTKDCPFIEGIFDLDNKVLALMSTVKKDGYHMIARIDDNGDIIRPKMARSNGKQYKEQRAQLETFQEFYISEKPEIINMIQLLAVNHNEFDYTKSLDYSPLIEAEKPKIELIKP